MATKKTTAAKKEKKASAKKDSIALSAEDIRAKSPDELKALVLNFKKDQFNTRFQKLAGEVAKPSRTRAIRRNIARIKTVQTQNRIKESANA